MNVISVMFYNDIFPYMNTELFENEYPLSQWLIKKAIRPGNRADCKTGLARDAVLNSVRPRPVFIIPLSRPFTMDSPFQTAYKRVKDGTRFWYKTPLKCPS